MSTTPRFIESLFIDLGLVDKVFCSTISPTCIHNPLVKFKILRCYDYASINVSTKPRRTRTRLSCRSSFRPQSECPMSDIWDSCLSMWAPLTNPSKPCRQWPDACSYRMSTINLVSWPCKYESPLAIRRSEEWLQFTLLFVPWTFIQNSPYTRSCLFDLPVCDYICKCGQGQN